MHERHKNDIIIQVSDILQSELEGKRMRVNITLECTECGDRNYITTKNKRENPERIELKKYCPRLRRVTLHRETK